MQRHWTEKTKLGEIFGSGSKITWNQMQESHK